MTSLVIASQKGGVGKTTVAVNVSYSLARRGWQVLLVDADPQGGIRLSLSENSEQSPGFFNLLIGNDPAGARQLIQPTRLPELHLLLSGKSEDYFGSEAYRNPEVLRENLIEIISQLDGHQLVVFDTASGVQGLTGELMRAADFLLLPQQAEPLSVRSIPHLLRVITTIRDPETHRPEIAGLLLTMVRHDETVSLEIEREVREMLPPELVLDAVIPRDSEFVKASQAGVPLALLHRQPSASALSFDQLAAELEKRMNLKPAETEQTDEHYEYTRLVD